MLIRNNHHIQLRKSFTYSVVNVFKEFYTFLFVFSSTIFFFFSFFFILSFILVQLEHVNNATCNVAICVPHMCGLNSKRTHTHSPISVYFCHWAERAHASIETHIENIDSIASSTREKMCFELDEFGRMWVQMKSDVRHVREESGRSKEDTFEPFWIERTAHGIKINKFRHTHTHTNAGN